MQHCEEAFESCINDRGHRYLRMDQRRRSLVRGTRAKSFDFLVESLQETTRWLVELKGRKVVAGGSWQTWVTSDDLLGLAKWQQAFSGSARAMIVFAFWSDEDLQAEIDAHYLQDGRSYRFLGINLDDYRKHARLRSRRWGTVAVPVRQFLRHAHRF